MKKLSKNYASKIHLILKKIIDEEEKKFTKAAKIISDSYKKGGQLYIFGTGHSRLLGEEAFHRAGGFAAACPIRDDNLSFQKGAKKATPFCLWVFVESTAETQKAFIFVPELVYIM